MNITIKGSWNPLPSDQTPWVVQSKLLQSLPNRWAPEGDRIRRSLLRSSIYHTPKWHPIFGKILLEGTLHFLLGKKYWRIFFQGVFPAKIRILPRSSHWYKRWLFGTFLHQLHSRCHHCHALVYHTTLLNLPYGSGSPSTFTLAVKGSNYHPCDTSLKIHLY